METCARCGKQFDRDEAESEFISEYSLYSYDNFARPLCYECAEEIIEEEEIGEYYETCEKCGKYFDLFTEKMDFSNIVSSFCDDVDLTDMWDEILCAECAAEKLEEEIEQSHC